MRADIQALGGPGDQLKKRAGPRHPPTVTWDPRRPEGSRRNAKVGNPHQALEWTEAKHQAGTYGCGSPPSQSCPARWGWDRPRQVGTSRQGSPSMEQSFPDSTARSGDERPCHPSGPICGKGRKTTPPRSPSAQHRDQPTDPKITPTTTHHPAVTPQPLTAPPQPPPQPDSDGWGARCLYGALQQGLVFGRCA